MRRGAGKLQVIFACIFSRPTARNLTRLNACGSWFGAAVFTTATLQPWMTSSLLLNLYSKFGPAQTLRCNVSVGFFNIMQLFMSLCLDAPNGTFTIAKCSPPASFRLEGGCLMCSATAAFEIGQRGRI